MPLLSVIILTKNEENNIEATVKNALLCADEVLVVDSGSTDRTVELAKKSGARVVYRAWDNDFSAQRNFALSQTEAEWVLYLDADEHLNHELVTAIKRVMSENVSIVDRSSGVGHIMACCSPIGFPGCFPEIMSNGREKCTSDRSALCPWKNCLGTSSILPIRTGRNGKKNSAVILQSGPKTHIKKENAPRYRVRCFTVWAAYLKC